MYIHVSAQVRYPECGLTTLGCVTSAPVLSSGHDANIRLEYVIHQCRPIYLDPTQCCMLERHLTRNYIIIIIKDSVLGFFTTASNHAAYDSHVKNGKI